VKPLQRKKKTQQLLFHSAVTCKNNNTGCPKDLFLYFLKYRSYTKQQTVEPATPQPNRGKKTKQLSIHLSCPQLRGCWGRACPTRQGTELVQQVEQPQELVFHHLRQQRGGFLQVLGGVKLLCNFFFYYWSSSSDTEFARQKSRK